MLTVWVFGNLLLTANADAQSTSKQKKKLEATRNMRVSYGSSNWNGDSRKVDSSYLLVRDKNTGKTVQIQLEETEPDSGQFDGNFSINMNETEKVAPEIYVPPDDMRKSEKDLKKVYEMVQSGKLPRKPVIWKKNERGQSVLDVYDTREQAETALKAYQTQQKLAQELRRKKPLKGLSSGDAMMEAQQAERKAKLAELALQAATRESDRVRMEQLERQRLADLLAKFQALIEQERNDRRKQAAELNKQALALYNKGDFPQAEQLFRKAADLDPENKDYYYKYGICLYRNQKFNEALVNLKIAKVPVATETERTYYLGLVHLRLTELDAALSKFAEVEKSHDKVMAPSATFYKGVIQFTQEKYEPAKSSFETVIDTSTDPVLDQQAEEYIDRIASALAYQKMRENKWSFTGTLGFSYDSNVLLTPNNQISTSSGTGDVRALTMGTLQYRPIFNEKHEFTPNITANLTNSKDSDNATGDPWIYTFVTPFAWKGQAFKSKKNYKLTLTPGYELLYLATAAGGTKTEQLHSYYLTTDTTLIMSPVWFSSYSLDLRSDGSNDASSIGVNDSDATRITVRTTQTIVFGKNKKRMLLPALGYISNDAKGGNRKYNRYDVGITYLQPAFWSTTWNTGLNYYDMRFPDSDDNRDDHNYAISMGLTKPIRSWVTWGVNGNYSINNSTVEANAYRKYVIMTTATFMTNF